jgi:hypothetical protein
MKVVSKLVKMDFAVGEIQRKDQYIIIISDPERSTMEAKVRLSPQDAWDLVKAGLKWSVISYVLSLPFLYRKEKQAMHQ